MGLFLVGIIFTSIPSAEALIADRQGTLVSERMNAWTLFGGPDRFLVLNDTGLGADISGLYAQFNNQRNTFLVDFKMKGNPTILDCKIIARMVKGDTFSGATKVFVIIEQSSKKISRGTDNFITDSIQNFERVEVNNPLSKPLRPWILADFSNTGFGVEQATDNKRSNLVNFTSSCRIDDTVLPTIVAPANIEQIATNPPSGNEILILGTPSVNDDIDPNPTVTISGIPENNIYPIGITYITYTVRDFAGNVGISATQTVTIVNPHPTTVILDTIRDHYVGDNFIVTGKLIDDDTGTGVPGKTVQFTGTGAVGLASAITSGFTVTDNSGIVIDACCSPSDNILRLSQGAYLNFTSKPIFVTLSLKDMGTSLVSVTFLNGTNYPNPASAFGQGQNIGLFSFTDPGGIKSIQIESVSDGGKAGITRVETFTLDGTRIIDEEFGSIISSNPTTLSFSEGTFISETTALALATDLVVNAQFNGAPGYLASVSEKCNSGATAPCIPPDQLENVRTYSIFYNTNGGYGAASGATEVSGANVTSVLCAAGNDWDRDALCNDWEGGVAGTGVPIGGNPNNRYILQGSDPNRKDIYVEVDYMEAHNPFVAAGSAASPNDAIEDVMKKFGEAPVINPNATVSTSATGIALHVDQGESLTHSTPTSMWSGFNSLKSANFGTPSERAAGSATIAAKAQAYHYVLFAHSVGGSSGVAEQRGNDAIITLGVGFGEVNATHSGTEGTRNQTAGTFMHELGHLVNLNHGGPRYNITDATQTSFADEAVNCKPNHDSVMSYSRQLPNLLAGNWTLDYSDGDLGPAGGLRESTLAENGTTGVGNLVHIDNSIRPGTDPLPWIIWGTPGKPQTFLVQISRLSAGTPANIDWSGEGVINATNVARDINNFGFYGCQATGPTSTFYKNYNEWANIEFNYRQGPSGQFDAAVGDDPQELDSTITGQLDILSAYHQTVSPWNAVSFLSANAGSNIPIKPTVYSGQNIAIVDDSTVAVKYKVYKASGGEPIATGDLQLGLGHWHADYNSLKQKGDYYIQIIVSDLPGDLVHTITVDPDTDADPNTAGKQPYRTNDGKLMSMKFTLT